MKQVLTSLFLGAFALIMSSCSCINCNSCYPGLPGGACEPCPKPPKPLKPPKVKRTCHLPRWPDRPKTCVATQIIRKCCDYETVCTPKGQTSKIEVCEITYRTLYTDGSTKIWTEVSRNPVKPGAMLGSNHPPKHAFVKSRCAEDESVQYRIKTNAQKFNNHIGESLQNVGHAMMHHNE